MLLLLLGVDIRVQGESYMYRSARGTEREVSHLQGQEPCTMVKDSGFIDLWPNIMWIEKRLI